MPKDTIEDRTKLATSVMREGLVSDLTIGQFASLIDFIESIGKRSVALFAAGPLPATRSRRLR